MLSRFRAFAPMIFVSTLAGCASGPYKPLDASARSKVTASEGVVGIQQSELNVSVQPVVIAPVAAGGTFAGGFVAGFLGSLMAGEIENSNLKRAEESAAPLRNELLDFDFDGKMFSSMQAQLGKVGWLHLDKVVMTKDASSVGYDKLLQGGPTPYTLFVSVDYFLTIDFKQLDVSARITLLPKAAPGSTVHQGPNGTTFIVPASDPSNAIYTNTVSYVATVPEGDFERLKAQLEASPSPGNALGRVGLANAAALQYWSQDNADAMKKALTEASGEVSRLVTECLMNPGKLSGRKDEVAVATQEGHILDREGDTRIVIQFDDGSIMSADMQIVKFLRTSKLD